MENQVHLNFDETQCDIIVDNDGDGTIKYCGLADCAAKCNAIDNCVSFEYSKESHPEHGKTCALSSTCNTYEMTVKTVNDGNYWYLRQDEIDGYTVHTNGGCMNQNKVNGVKKVLSNFGNAVGRTGGNGFTVNDCAILCSGYPDCVSFEYSKMSLEDYGIECRLSSTCITTEPFRYEDLNNDYWYKRNSS
mmetsp:Transcript_10173/g.11282  ORF Transcript_10173/g.11282 Transcript_10173/m.11282 type:complete len:190 (-) Transcript_10173:348-917(-)